MQSINREFKEEISSFEFIRLYFNIYPLRFTTRHVWTLNNSLNNVGNGKIILNFPFHAKRALISHNANYKITWPRKFSPFQRLKGKYLKRGHCAKVRSKYSYFFKSSIRYDSASASWSIFRAISIFRVARCWRKVTKSPPSNNIVTWL